MRTLFTAILTMALALAFTGTADAAGKFGFLFGHGTSTFFAVLNAAQEVRDGVGPDDPPPVNSTAMGNALMDFDKKTKLLCYQISYTKLMGTETVAHFHGPAAIGENASIRRNISVNDEPSPAVAPKTGCVGPLTNEEIRELKKGLWYINIHSTEFGPGEIRGQVLPVDRPKRSFKDDDDSSSH